MRYGHFPSFWVLFGIFGLKRVNFRSLKQFSPRNLHSPLFFVLLKSKIKKISSKLGISERWRFKNRFRVQIPLKMRIFRFLRVKKGPLKIYWVKKSLLSYQIITMRSLWKHKTNFQKFGLPPTCRTTVHPLTKSSNPSPD